MILCCSNNGHYDIVYPRHYPAIAALCQCESLIVGVVIIVCVSVYNVYIVCLCVAMLYELLYTRVFGVEEADLCQALEAFRVGGRRYRNSPSACSDGDLGYDTPEDPPHRYFCSTVLSCTTVVLSQTTVVLLYPTAVLL